MAKSAETMTLQGAGSSFIRPVMQRWVASVPETAGLSATYKAVGTSVAQSAVMAGEIDFAAIELPLPAKALADGDLMQFPVAFGALVCVVNLPGIGRDQLQLTGQLLGAIYSGTIKTWDDPKIAAVNPGVTLPNLPIAPLRLDTPAGTVFSTTYTFTQYLLATNPDWRAKYGAEVPRRWAVGSMTDGSEALAETLKVVPGSIGYMALGAAMASGATTVKLRNKSGRAVAASMESLRAAVDRVDWSKTPDMVPSLLDLEGEGTWPLVLTSYALLQRHPKDAARGAAVRRLIDFFVVHGAESAAKYASVALTPLLSEGQRTAKTEPVRSAVLAMLAQTTN